MGWVEGTLKIVESVRLRATELHASAHKHGILIQGAVSYGGMCGLTIVKPRGVYTGSEQLKNRRQMVGTKFPIV